MNAIEQMKRAARNAEETIADVIKKQLEAHAKLHEAFQRTPADELENLRKASGELAGIETIEAFRKSVEESRRALETLKMGLNVNQEYNVKTAVDALHGVGKRQ